MLTFDIFSNTLSDLFKTDSLEASKDDYVHEYGDSNRALWRAVILQAVIDIINSSARTENKIAKIEAKQWIFTENENFARICHLAGYNQKFIRKKVMEVMRQNLISKIILNKMHKEEKFNLGVNCFYSDNQMRYEKKIQCFNYF